MNLPPQNDNHQALFWMVPFLLCKEQWIAKNLSQVGRLLLKQTNIENKISRDWGHDQLPRRVCVATHSWRRTCLGKGGAGEGSRGWTLKAYLGDIAVSLRTGLAVELSKEDYWQRVFCPIENFDADWWYRRIKIDALLETLE